ncbi:MAG: acyl-ACP--UDP-N-acetylglucosamine O-acyltransferase [Oceanobacter sp.]
MIHPTAIIDPKASLAADVEVGPFSVIGADVEIGSGTWIGPHVVIKGPTSIGKNNKIYQFASIGEDCQDKKYAGEPTRLVIGDNNVIREACSLHRGTVQDEGVTTIGSHNLLMVNVHVAHDCIIGDQCILANDTNLAGHVRVGDWAILGGSTQVHQFCQIGAHTMVGTGTVVLKDIPAYVKASGYPAEPHGINAEGLRRRGFDTEVINEIRTAYKTVYRQGNTVAEALQALESVASVTPEVALLLDSIKAASRGIIR